MKPRRRGSGPRNAPRRREAGARTRRHDVVARAARTGNASVARTRDAIVDAIANAGAGAWVWREGENTQAESPETTDIATAARYGSAMNRHSPRAIIIP